MSIQEQTGKAPRRDLDLQMDRLESDIEKLRVLYEQHFIDILPHPPDKEHQAVSRQIKVLLKAPFKNSQSRFRLRQIIQRFQTYATYWERVVKQREDGTYVKDKFKAEMREKMARDLANQNSAHAKANKGLQDLFSSYKDALQKSGANTGNVDFDRFKQKMIAQAKALKKQHGVKKVKYSVVTKGGKVIIKATAKE